MYTAEQIVQAVLAAGGTDDVFDSKLERAAKNENVLLNLVGQFLYDSGMEVTEYALTRAVEILSDSLS